MQPGRYVGHGDLAAGDEAAGEQLLAGLEVDGGDEVAVEEVEIAHRALDAHVIGHLDDLERPLDLVERGVRGDILRQHVHRGAPLAGDGLVLGGLHVGDEGERAHSRQRDGGDDADDSAFHGGFLLLEMGTGVSRSW